MADNSTLPAIGNVIAADNVTTLNGVGSTNVLVQRMKLSQGAPLSARDVSGAFPLPVNTDGGRTISYRGRCCTFRTPGRAGPTGQKIFAIHNATASTILVDIERVTIDMVQTVIKAVTVLPPAVRMYRVTVVPTNGTAGTKVARDTSLSSNSSLTVWQDASADGTSSATALTATLPAGNVLSQFFAPRMITAAGYEMLDTFAFMEGPDQLITLRALEGVVIMLDYTLATQNPVTDMWTVDCKWTEYTASA